MRLNFVLAYSKALGIIEDIPTTSMSGIGFLGDLLSRYVGRYT